MMWGIYWHPAALHGFNALHMDDAERLDAVVIGFARRGAGRSPRLHLLTLAGSGFSYAARERCSTSIPMRE